MNPKVDHCLLVSGELYASAHKCHFFHPKVLMKIKHPVQKQGDKGAQAHGGQHIGRPMHADYEARQRNRSHSQNGKASQHHDQALRATGALVVHEPQNRGLERQGGGVRCQRGSFHFLPFALSGASTHAATALNACPLEPVRAPALPQSAHATDSSWDSGAWAVRAGFSTRGWAASLLAPVWLRWEWARLGRVSAMSPAI